MINFSLPFTNRYDFFIYERKYVMKIRISTKKIFNIDYLEKIKSRIGSQNLTNEYKYFGQNLVKNKNCTHRMQKKRYVQTENT